MKSWLHLFDFFDEKLCAYDLASKVFPLKIRIFRLTRDFLYNKLGKYDMVALLLKFN